MSKIDEKIADEELNKNARKAEKIVDDPNKFEKFCKDTEEKLKKIKLEDILAYAPIMLQMVNSYRKKEYTKVPVRIILSVIGALIYLVAPIDLIPDIIPLVGHVDDAMVFAACLKFAKQDLDDYVKWKESL